MPTQRTHLTFSKYHGIGNDFIVVDEPVHPTLTQEQVRRMCDRHRGIGGDGVLLVRESPHPGTEPTMGAMPTMTVLNRDGSTAQMCGNGIRCVALHLLRRGSLPPGQPVWIETDAGPHECTVVHADSLGDSPHRAMVRVQMRAPEVKPIMTLSAQGRTLQALAVSMGNPHIVTFDELGDARHALGPALETHPSFPGGVNVNFARMQDDGSIELHVWERGAGWTQACGTGACATATAAVTLGLIAPGSPIQVMLPGGPLTIDVPDLAKPMGPVHMTGEAAHVFDGVWPQHSIDRG
jgi:diaminopimelate epimerase